MASARCRLLDPVPLRKMERQTRVSRRFASCSSREFAMSDPYEFLALQRSRTVHQEVALVIARSLQPDQRARRWPRDFRPIPREFAAMARASNDAQLGIPCCQTAQVGADRGHRVDAFRS